MLLLRDKIIENMKARTAALKLPVQVIPPRKRLIITRTPCRQAMRPRTRMTDRNCDLRGGSRRVVDTVWSGNGVDVTLGPGRRGARRPRYKTHNQDRRNPPMN